MASLSKDKNEKLPNDARELFPFIPRHFAVDKDNSITYIDEGNPGNPVLVMIHACPMCMFEFRLAIFSLSKRFRVIAYDQMGFGFSDHPQNYDYRIENHIGHLERFLNFLGLHDNISLLMHGRGTTIGIGYAVRHASAIRSLMVMNAPSFSDFHLPFRLAMFRFQRIPSCFFLLMKQILFPGLRYPPAVRHAYTFRLSRRNMPAMVNFICSLPLVPEDQTARSMIEIETAIWVLRHKPMLILWGDRDWLYNDNDMTRWRSYFPDAEFHPIHGAGRFLTEDAPRQYLDYVTKFLNKVFSESEEGN